MEEPNYELVDLDTIFTNELNEMMKDNGLDYSQCSKEEVRKTIALATSYSRKCYEDFMMWVLYGDNNRAKTLGLLRATLKAKRNDIFKRFK